MLFFFNLTWIVFKVLSINKSTNHFCIFLFFSFFWEPILELIAIIHNHPSDIPKNSYFFLMCLIRLYRCTSFLVFYQVLGNLLIYNCTTSSPIFVFYDIYSILYVIICLFVLFILSSNELVSLAIAFPFSNLSNISIWSLLLIYYTLLLISSSS